MQDVIDAMFEKSVKPGEYVIHQGDDGDNFYVIDHGLYDVLVNVNDQEKKIHRFDNRGSFGELALMYNMPRSASIVANSRTEQNTKWFEWRKLEMAQDHYIRYSQL